MQASTVVGYAGADLTECDQGISAGACFIPVSGDTIDLGDIKVVGNEGALDSEVEAQTLDEYGGTDRSYYWMDTVSPATGAKFYGWYYEDEPYADLDDDDKVFLAPGEGLFVQIYTEEPVKLQSSGEVPTKEDIATGLAACDEGKLIVNPSPIDVDLGNCKISGYGDAKTDSEIEVQTLDVWGGTDKSYYWMDTVSPATGAKFYGWYYEDEPYDDLSEEDKLTIKPGNGVFVQTYGDWEFEFVWPKVVIAK